MILLLPSLNPVPSLYCSLAWSGPVLCRSSSFPGSIPLFDSLTANRVPTARSSLPKTFGPLAPLLERGSAILQPNRLRGRPCKKWPQGLHRSTDYPLNSTGTDYFSSPTVPFARPATRLRSLQTAPNPPLCIYIGSRIRKVTSTFRQSMGKTPDIARISPSRNSGSLLHSFTFSLIPAGHIALT